MVPIVNDDCLPHNDDYYHKLQLGWLEQTCIVYIHRYVYALCYTQQIQFANIIIVYVIPMVNIIRTVCMSAKSTDFH